MINSKEKIIIERIIRSNRKSLSISISSEAGIIIRAPHNISDMVIHDLVQKKREWITDKIDKIKRRPERKFIQGEIFPFLGSDYTLSPSSEKKIYVSGERLEIPESFLTLQDSKITEQRLIDWYRKQARIVINSRIKTISSDTGINWASIRISGARRRWGSCGARGSLNFSWRLVMCPVDVIDYVIVHELVHISIRNHSRAFWKKVEEIMPDYRDKENWLKNNSGHINF